MVGGDLNISLTKHCQHPRVESESIADSDPVSRECHQDVAVAAISGVTTLRELNEIRFLPAQRSQWSSAFPMPMP